MPSDGMGICRARPVSEMTTRLGPVLNGATPGKRQAAPAKIHLSSARRQAQANLHVEPPCSTDTPEHWLDLHEVPQLACQPLGLVLGDQRVGVLDLDQFRVSEH